MTRAELEALADAKRPDNPPAFPTDGRIQHGTAYDGMSLRDWFAGQALAGLLADTSVEGLPRIIATASYALADAMLAARAQEQS